MAFLDTKASPPRDSLGCSLSKLSDDVQLHGGNLTFYRKRANAAPLGQVNTPATNRGYLIGLSASGGHSRRIFREHHAVRHDFEANSIYVRNFADAYKADLSGAFDFMLLEVSQAGLEQIADGADVSRVNELTQKPGHKDAVLGGMLAAMFSTVGGRTDRSALFIDQLSVAIGIHLVHHYSNGRIAEPHSARALSPQREARVKDLLRSRMKGEVTIEELAAACNLSPATFLRAFRETTGRTPHQWLKRQRIENAMDLLQNTDRSLQDITIACGFSDQSHFSRVFASVIGAPPGAWRRSRLS